MSDSDPYLTPALDELERLVSLVDNTAAEAEIPGCDDWTVGEMAAHVAAVLGMIGETRLADATDAPVRPGPLPEGQPVGTGIAERGRVALEALAAAPAETPMWSWVDPTIGFWRRRIYFELVMHRVDAQRAAGETADLDPAVASEAIDEFLTTYVLGRGLWQKLDGASVHLHCTDTEGEWTLRTEGGSPELTREHAKGDLALRGPAVDLALVLYGRESVESTEVDRFGDDAVAEAVTSWTV